MTSFTAQPAALSPTSQVSDNVSCAHCDLPVPRGLVDSSAEEQFCCDGCRMVFAILREQNLGEFHRLQKLADSKQPAATTGEDYTYFDDSGFHEAHVREFDDHSCEVTLSLTHIHCAACVWLIEKLPRLTPGVIDARVSLRKRTATIRWDRNTTNLSAIARTLDSIGYPSQPYVRRQNELTEQHESRRLLIHIAISGAIAANVMVIAFALYGDTFHGMAPAFRHFFRGSSLLLTLVALAWPGRTFFRGAIAAVRTRTAHMDIPIAIGLTAGAVAGLVNTLRGSGEVYFESITALIFLLLLGRWLQHRQRRQSYAAVDLLAATLPAKAHLVNANDQSAEDVSASSIVSGQVVEVRAGEIVPVDGRVVRGQSRINAAVLTGESRPHAISIGDAVEAGAINVAAAIHVLAESTGEETRIGRLMTLVERAAEQRTPIVQLANRVASRFVWIVVALAGLTAIGWLWIDPSRSVECAIALLIVTCPCALGLATPLAVLSAVSQAAHRGILIRGGDVLERLATNAESAGLILLDKTGTITEGNMRITEWYGCDEVRPLVAAIERHSSHPVAAALVADFVDVELPSIERVEETPGRGIEAWHGEQHVAIGSRKFVEQFASESKFDFQVIEQSMTARAISPVFVSVDGFFVAMIGVGDPIREDVPAAIESLRNAGWSIGILSGDHPDVVAAVAAELGIDSTLALGGMLPEEKLVVVNDHLQTQRVVMVGDGVNDAAALSAATVGIAVEGGAEASLQVADVYLSRPGLSPLVELMHGSKITIQLIRRNLSLSLFYNVITGTLAIAGLINPMIAAILMPVSSLTVIAASYRARIFINPRA